MYSLEQLEQDNPGGDAFKQMKNELHERILQLCKARTDTFQLMGYQQREHVRREVSDLKQEVWRLKNMQEELQKKVGTSKHVRRAPRRDGRFSHGSRTVDCSGEVTYRTTQ